MTRFPFPFSLMHKRTLTHQCCHKHRVTYYNRHFSPFQVSSCPLSHLGAPTLTLPASSLLPTSSLGTVWHNSSKPAAAPSFLPNYPPLASSFVPIPGKLTLCIQLLEFIEMQEPLPDNLVLAECLESLLARLALARTPEQQKWGWGYLGVLLSHIY